MGLNAKKNQLLGAGLFFLYASHFADVALNTCHNNRCDEDA